MRKAQAVKTGKQSNLSCVHFPSDLDSSGIDGSTLLLRGSLCSGDLEERALSVPLLPGLLPGPYVGVVTESQGCQQLPLH